MYSRKTGIMYNYSEAQKKIDSFNNNIREQYRQRNTPTDTPTVTEPVKREAQGNSLVNKVTNILTDDDIIIIGLILLLLLEENKDYMLIGVLAALLFLSR